MKSQLHELVEKREGTNSQRELELRKKVSQTELKEDKLLTALKTLKQLFEEESNNPSKFVEALFNAAEIFLKVGVQAVALQLYLKGFDVINTRGILNKERYIEIFLEKASTVEK